MSIRFCPNVAEIVAGARWRGFLTIPPLRDVHRAAFLAIARAVGATAIIFIPDYADELIDAAEEGKGFEECLKLIEEKWGPMEGDLDEIRPAVIANCATCPAKVWSDRGGGDAPLWQEARAHGRASLACAEIARHRKTRVQAAMLCGRLPV
jgi:hypothetical protein